MEGYQSGKSIKNGPALAGHGAEAVRKAITRSMTNLPERLRQSLPWDQDAEIAQHARLGIGTRLCIGTRLGIYFCDPQSPWQRGTNENPTGLLRQYFPQGTDFSRHPARELEAVAQAMNTRPRKTPGWQTPAAILDGFLTGQDQASVATTG